MPVPDQPSVTLSIRLLVAHGIRERTLSTFHSLAGQVRGERGCIRCQLLADVQEPDELVLIHTWRSRVDLERYVRSPRFTRLLTGLDLAAEKPEVELQTGSSDSGFEFFEKVLARGKD